MKKFILLFTLFFMFVSVDAQAARFGRGRSFGTQRSSQGMNRSWSNNKQQQQQKQASQKSNTNTPAPKSSWASKIFPMLAGLSMGALLGSLLSGHGLGGGLGVIFMVLMAAGICFFIIRKLMASRVKSNYSNQNHHYQNFQQATAQAGAGTQTTDRNAPFSSAYQPQESYYNTSTTNNNLHDNEHELDTEEFLRSAKTMFLRMQNAYDDKNLGDIKQFTTPEVFAEIQMQLQERGSVPNHTEVLYIHANLADSLENNNTSASAIFSGQIKEDQNSSAVHINEMWHFVKEGNNWLISGIEQK